MIIEAWKNKGAVATLTALPQPARMRAYRALVGAMPAGLTPGERGGDG